MQPGTRVRVVLIASMLCGWTLTPLAAQSVSLLSFEATEGYGNALIRAPGSAAQEYSKAHWVRFAGTVRLAGPGTIRPVLTVEEDTCGLNQISPDCGINATAGDTKLFLCPQSAPIPQCGSSATNAILARCAVSSGRWRCVGASSSR